MTVLAAVNNASDSRLVGQAQDYARLLKGAKSGAEVEKTAKSFESMFLKQMLEHMFEDVGDDSISGNQYGDDVYRGWMVEEYARLITDRGGIGLAAQVKSELLKLQEVGGEGLNGALPAKKQ